MSPPFADLLRPGMQSALSPQASHAEAVAALAWVMFAGAAIVFLAVLVLTAWSLRAPRGRRRCAASRRFVLAGGLALPLVVLTALLAYAASLTPQVAAAPRAGDLKIEIVGEQWWWRVHYLDARGERLFATANELQLPVGRPVELILKSADVIHSFWVPSLAGKADMIPGRVRRLRFAADHAGVYRGQCAEYCGGPHAQMALYVVARPQAEFAQWQAAQQRPAAPPPPALVAGRTLFLQHCAACHTLRGTPAEGEIGPDLTHVGSRLALGAGTLPNGAGTLAAWIAGSQHLKPGNLMPSMNVVGAAEVRAIADYLASLE